jgi:hypothetical protein
LTVATTADSNGVVSSSGYRKSGSCAETTGSPAAINTTAATTRDDKVLNRANTARASPCAARSERGYDRLDGNRVFEDDDAGAARAASKLAGIWVAAATATAAGICRAI